MLDVFGGTGGVARAVRRQGFAAKVWDLRASPAHDLTKKEVIDGIVRALKRGEVMSLMLAPPCTSWSIARCPTNVIRSSELPWGVAFPPKPFTRKDLEQLNSGNVLLRNTLRIIDEAIKQKVPWIFEHPHASFAFKTPEFARLLERPDVDEVIIDQCAFRACYRKRTRLVCFRACPFLIEHLASKKCHGKRVCDFSKRPHVHLMGASCRRAQTYPAAMSKCLAKVLTEQERSGRILRAGK